MHWARMLWWGWRFTPSYSLFDGLRSHPFRKELETDGAPVVPSNRHRRFIFLLLLLRLADGAAGLYARGPQQARDLFEMELHGVGAQNLSL